MLPAHNHNESRASLIAGVGVETLLDRGTRQLPDLLSHGQFRRYRNTAPHFHQSTVRLPMRVPLYLSFPEQISQEDLFSKKDNPPE